jgi:hypothetical protein
MDYALKDLAEFTESQEGERIGMLIRCPNCGIRGGVMFAGTEFRKKNPGVTWERTGDSLENITLNPSVGMNGHFHSWVKNGQLCVDSLFSCTKASDA